MITGNNITGKKITEKKKFLSCYLFHVIFSLFFSYIHIHYIVKYYI